MQSPLVSIIIATYNSGKTISQALQSVVGQRFQDWECIVVDGKSKDDTVQIVKQFADKDSRITFVSEPDKGIYDALNKGWKMAKGEWVHYLGSDDRLTENSFCELLQNPVVEDVAVVSGSANIVKIDGAVKRQYAIGWSGCHQAKLTRRSVMEQMNGFDEQYSILADLNLFIRIKQAGYKVQNFGQPVCFFSMDGVSQKFRGTWGRHKEYVKVFRTDPDEKHPVLHATRITLRTLVTNTYRKITKFIKGRRK